MNVPPAGGDLARRLADVEAIKALHARYLRLLDDRLPGEMRELFTDDARIEASSRTFDDPEGFVAYLADPANRPRWTVHHGHMPEIELLDEHSGRAIWQLAAHAGVDDGAGGERVVARFGRYQCEVRKGPDGAWRYALLRLTISAPAFDMR